MLQRTVSRTEGGRGPRVSWRPVIVGLTFVLLFSGLYLLLPDPGPRSRPMALTTDELVAKILSHRMPDLPPPSRLDKRRAAFGFKLFADAGLSQGGKPCEACHAAARSFTDGRTAATLVNAAQNAWFLKDGRADSLAEASLLELENPRANGVSRLFVVNHVKNHYATDYEEAFGAWPAALKKLALPPDALPPPAELKLPLELSAYALSSLGSFPLLTDILKTAQAARLAPAIELAHRALARPAPEPSWTEAWKKLTPEEQEGVNQVFAEVGAALAAYLTGLVAAESPFDRFAARVAAGKKPEEALDTGFGAKELQGLALFDGSLGCGGCHGGPGFSDQRFHNLGLPSLGDHVDLGRAVAVLARDGDPFTCFGTLLKRPELGAWPVSCERPAWAETDLTALVYAFKTPTLRNLQDTAPYMHDGRFASLGKVLDFYSDLDGKPAAGRRQKGLARLDLTPEERQALLAFLGALGSQVRDQRTGQTLSVKP